jgi:hypothetical protein
MRTDLSTSLHRNLLKALDPSALLLKGGKGSGPHPGPDQSRAADEAWDTRGRGQKGDEGRKRSAAPDKPKGKRKKGEEPKSPPLLEPEEIMSRAEALAERAHEGQTRGHGKEDVPYIEHPREIAERLKEIEGQDAEVVAAAYLHDAVEDTDLTVEEIAQATTPRVAELVEALTDTYTKENYPDLNRRQRKMKYREKLRKAPREAKMIKLLDRISNLNDMKGADPKFQRLYAKESELLLSEALEGTDEKLEEELRKAIGQVQRWSMGDEGPSDPDEPTGKNPQKSVISSYQTLKDSIKDPSLAKDVRRLKGKESGIGETYRVEFKDGTMGIYKPTKGTGLEKGFKGAPEPIDKKPKKRPMQATTKDEAFAEYKRFVREYYMEPEDKYEMPEAIKMTFDPEIRAYRIFQESIYHPDDFQVAVQMYFYPDRGEGEITSQEFDMSKYAQGRFTLDKSIPESRRERAAYELSSALGFNIVPQVEFVDYGEGEGHVQAYVEGIDCGTDIGDAQFDEDVLKSHPDIHRIAALDMILGNTDRHFNNLRYGGDGRYYAIDNGLMIPNNSHHREFNSEVMAELMRLGTDKHKKHAVIPEEVRQEIQALDPKKLAEIMDKQGFPDVDIKGAQARLEALKGLEAWPVGEEFFDRKEKNFDARLYMESIKAGK